MTTYRLGPFSASSQYGATFVPAVSGDPPAVGRDWAACFVGNVLVSLAEMEALADDIEAAGLQYVDLVRSDLS